MRNTFAKIVGLVCIILMLPYSAGAEKSGICGENITWSLENGTLTIEGGGYMTDLYLSDADKESVTSVVIGDGVVYICDNAFSGFTNLSRVEIPESVKWIGCWAFMNCTSLTCVQLPDGLEKIDMGAFSYSGLESIELPESLLEIGNSAFNRCSKFTEIEIPDNVISIGERAFNECVNVGSITIGEAVEYIGSDAFYNCKLLEDLYWKATKTNDLKSDNGVLYNAGKETDGLRVVFKNGVTRIPAYLFYPDMNSVESFVSFSQYTPRLVNVSIPASVNSIGEHAFYDAVYLKEVTIPNGVKSIEEFAFDGAGLESVFIPKSVTDIGRGAFKSSETLYEIVVDSENEEYSSENGILFSKDKDVILQYPAGITDSSYQIPEKVTNIGEFAFYGNAHIVNVNIPDTVTYITRMAFAECTAIESIVIPDTVETIESGGGVFFRCYGLKEAKLPKNLTEIPGDLFHSCESLLSVEIPDKVRVIGNSAFAGCWELAEVTIPDSVTEIRDSAFSGCGMLTDIDLPENLYTIGSYGFGYCGSLTSVDIPDNVTEIDNSAFSNCYLLTDITLPKSLVKLGRNVFWGTKLKYVMYEGSFEEWQKIDKGSDEVRSEAKIYYNYHGQPLINFGAFHERRGVGVYPINCDNVTGAALILVIYDKNEALSDVKFLPYSEDAIFDVRLTKGTAKLMLWKGLFDPSPLAESVAKAYDFTSEDNAENEVIGGGTAGGDIGGGTAGGVIGGEVIGGGTAGGVIGGEVIGGEVGGIVVGGTVDAG